MVALSDRSGSCCWCGCRCNGRRVNPGEDSGNWYELFHETPRGALAERSGLEPDRTRFRLADSMGCINRTLKVAACLFLEDRGSSFEYEAVRRGGEVKGVSQRLREKSDEDFGGLSVPKNNEFRSSCSSVCRRPFWYLTLARPKRSCRLRET